MAEKCVSGGRLRWSDDMEDLLVDWWQQYECLYNVSSGTYHNKAEKERCWEEIAAALDLPVQEVKVRAASLRSQYSRLVRPMPGGERRTRTLTPRQKRILTSLEFLRKHVVPRNRDGNESDYSELDSAALSADHDSGASRSSFAENSLITRKRWTVGKENKLLELWEQHECLYNLSSDKFHNKIERERKWVEIASVLELPVEEVKTRATSLRTQYARLVKPGGSSRDKQSMTERQRKILSSCEFLKKHIIHRSSDSTMEESTQEGFIMRLDGSDGEPETPVLPPQDPEDGRASPSLTECSSVSLPPPRLHKKRPRGLGSEDMEQQKVALLQHVLEVIQETAREPDRDCEDSFGVTVAMELKRIRSVALRTRVKRQIMSVLYDALDSEQAVEDPYQDQRGFPREDSHSITVVIP
ncbi:uncharacterized protein LOC115393067 [Salarias fasciatus]|uniref:uncharacterized protein LOC115393067 n=1 Tax=Salarias fasciatus TaxID=181472 RepID=UPI001176D47E|nr:uncharacterized protein LOC115393067 [Salarias fasciatus]